MISKEKLKEIIVSNHQFILNQVKTIIKREDIRFPEESKKIIVLYGVRRSGKTFLLYELLKNYKDKSLYIDFEDERLINFELSDFEIVKEAFRELNPQFIDKPELFLFDEIQNIKDWEKFCRRVVEREDINIFVTGSSSKIMPMEIHTSLRGRAWSIEITPFSFREYLLAKNVILDKNYIYGPQKTITKRHFADYMKWGGFPEITSLEGEFEKNKVLKEYIFSMFFKDLVERFNINNIHLLDTLFDRLFSCFSLKFSLTAFYNHYKGKFSFSKDTLFNYYRHFLESMLIFEVRKFTESTYKRLRNPAKIYLIDTGLSKKVKSEDLGRVLENIVFLELRKTSGEEIFYFEEGKECDFVVKEKDRFGAYQVCFELTEENRKREIAGLVIGCKWLDIQEGILLTYDQEEEIETEGIKIKILPAWKWLLKI
ncbi:MAG: ATP-binding protein [bacterium]|nr:ATP-binding protein [bacterium]